MKIGILQTGHAPDALIPIFGDYNDMFKLLLAGNDFTYVTWNVVDGEFPETVQDADGWLLTGSRHSAYEALDWIPKLEEFIRDAITEKRPMVGICFGHQVIAQALGGKVEKSQNGWAVGPQSYDFGGVDIPLNAWHQDQVTDVPAGATVIAKNDQCANAAIVYGDRAFTVQAHPEFGPEFVEGLVNTRGKGVVPQDHLDSALEHLDDPIASQMIADQIADFFRMQRSP